MSVIISQSPGKPTFEVWFTAKDVNIVKLRAKDADAFKALYKLYAPAIYGSLFRITNDKAKCDYLLEQTFVLAWNTISLFDESKCSIFMWLSRISINLASAEVVR